MMLKTCIILSLSLIVAGDHVPTQDAKLDLNFSEDLLHGVFERLDSLESNLRKQADQNAELRKTMTYLQDENQKLTDQVNVLHARERVRDNEVKDLQKQVVVLTTSDKERNKEIDDFIAYIRQFTGNKEAVQEDGNKYSPKEPEKLFEEHITRRGVRHIKRRENDQNVAFFSALSNHLLHLGANQNVVFDHVITNIGNAYNNHAGDFRAPVAGTYVFSVTLMAYVSHTTHYHLVQNGTAVANIYVRGTESPYASSSMTAVLQLKQGEDVAITNVDTDEYLHGGNYATFSGFLLNQDYSSPAIVGR